jgi:hypothetical protein
MTARTIGNHERSKILVKVQTVPVNWTVLSWICRDANLQRGLRGELPLMTRAAFTGVMPYPGICVRVEKTSDISSRGEFGMMREAE